MSVRTLAITALLLGFLVASERTIEAGSKPVDAILVELKAPAASK